MRPAGLLLIVRVLLGTSPGTESNVVERMDGVNSSRPLAYADMKPLGTHIEEVVSFKRKYENEELLGYQMLKSR